MPGQSDRAAKVCTCIWLQYVCVFPASSCPAAVSPWTVYASEWWDPAPHLHIQTPPPPPPAPCPSSTVPPPLPLPWFFLSFSLFLSPPPLLFLPKIPLFRACLDTSVFSPSEQVVWTPRERKREDPAYTTPPPSSAGLPGLCVHVCTLYACVRVCVWATVPPRSMRSALPLQPPLPSQQMLSSHFLDGCTGRFSLCFTGRVGLLHSLHFFLPFSSSKCHFLITPFLSFSHKTDCYRVHFCLLLSAHCLYIDLLRALDVELRPANALLVRLILITGHIVHWATAVSYRQNMGLKY